MLNVYLVQPGQITEALCECLHHLRKPQEVIGERTGIDDVLRGLYDQVNQLVLVTEGETTIGCLVVNVQNYPLSRYLCITMFGGETGILDTHGDQIIAFLEDLARQQQCKGVEWIGRTGWRNWARGHGYEPFQVIYKKGLT